ncbi:MAG: hypothetical protein A2X86_13690 [Bdellovibrionales bacterium GWA2_49_15]|nr:MAG: hypothetical protein A2X86_13690 [Bdellovibrionales bacterium GWA2_49_15]HAZ13579.1 hypothetical protein [Bdellovibrionales bacterium]
MKILFWPLLLSLFSCSNDNFKKVETLDGFRVLAITSSNSEVAPGGSSVLQLFISDTKGGGRTIAGTFEACIDPGIAFGAEVRCDHDPNKALGAYVIDTVNDANLGAGNLYTGYATATYTATIPATILLGRSAREQYNGVSYIVIFSFTVDGVVVRSFKRIIATSRGTLNSAPAISNLFINGIVASGKPNKDDQLTLTTSIAEDYSYQNVDDVLETRSEVFEVAWYVSEGEISKPKALSLESVRYKTDPPATPMVLVVIMRDGRGGIAIHREVF